MYQCNKNLPDYHQSSAEKKYENSEAVFQWIALTPAAALRPNRHVSEAGRQAVPGLTASCGRPVRNPAGLLDCRDGPSRCILRQDNPFHLLT